MVRTFLFSRRWGSLLKRKERKCDCGQLHLTVMGLFSFDCFMVSYSVMVNLVGSVSMIVLDCTCGLENVIVQSQVE